MFQSIKNFITRSKNKEQEQHNKQVSQKLFRFLLDKNDTEFIKYFEEVNPSPDLKDAKGQTLLMNAICLTIEDQEMGEKLTKFLIDKGANVQLEDKQGQSPLLMACHWNIISIVKILIENGADINSCSRKQYMCFSPLYSSLFKGNYKIAAYLLRKGARTDNIQELYELNIKYYPLTKENLEFLNEFNLLKKRQQKRIESCMIQQMQQIEQKQDLEKSQNKNQNIQQNLNDEQIQELKGKNYFFGQINPKIFEHYIIEYI
ncbi:Ankyrin repeat-containing domain [Pseudocohnilembus persalinus]|uniref:Ankyrin repeat-containing domain n=1 Tax=Pseudocohnilembus persalinus TaxID=266149 RepID=A0A0V0QVV7_PSEPJ|nr:Ankyrin repeat-containing domain [Pseudocohnilembus persalinus]|eukprot:KRX06492.1 Ankyrin repeat-containing domain [Pseudocohnilembus persalinus]